MKLVIMECKAETPGNASWCVMNVLDECQADCFRLMGHRIVDVPEETANRLLDSMGKSISLQIELRELYYKSGERDLLTGSNPGL